MIASFADKHTGHLAKGIRVKKFESIAERAQLKLTFLNAADTLATLAALPSNRLEALSGDRRGQYSIRINDQYRICFRFDEGKAYDVEVVDYH